MYLLKYQNFKKIKFLQIEKSINIYNFILKMNNKEIHLPNIFDENQLIESFWSNRFLIIVNYMH